MKPKTNLDSIVEEFFNTGKLNINEITFPDSALEKLKHEPPPEEEKTTIDGAKAFLNKSIKDAEEEFKLAIEDAINAENDNDFQTAKKFYQQALSTLQRLGGYSNDEAYEGVYGKKELHNTINSVKAPLGDIEVYNFTQLKNDIDRMDRGEKREKSPEDEIDILSILEPEEKQIPSTEEESVEEIEDEVDITSMQKEINKWKSVDLDDATLEVLETYLPNPDDLEKLESKKEELEAIKNDPERTLDVWQKDDLKSLYSQINALKDQQKIVAKTIIDNPCIIHSVIYRNPANKNYFKPLMDKLVNIFDKKVNTTTSKLYKALFNSDKVPNNKINPFLDNIANYKVNPGSQQTQMQFDPETTKFCGATVLEEALKGKSFGHSTQEPIRNTINPQKNKKIQKWLEKAIDMAESIFNHIVSNKVLKQQYATRDKYEKLLGIIQKYSSGENEEEIIEGLTHVAFDLKEMDEMIKKYDLGNNSTQQNITTLINNVYDQNQVGDIKANLQQIRKSRNKQYEESFTTCVNPVNKKPYFINEPGGDTSSILQNPNWREGETFKFLFNNTELKRIMDLIFEAEYLNSFDGAEKDELRSFIQGKREKRSKYPVLDHTTITNTIGREAKIKAAAHLLFNNISSTKIIKYDIKAAQNVEVNRGNEKLIIPNKALVEVKLTSEYDYHLSEFFGVYKASESKLSSQYRKYPQYGEIYGRIIEELYILMTTGKGKNKGDEILDSIKDNTAGIFFEYYKYANMKNDVILKWDLEGQRKTEKRLSIRCVVDESKLYTWNVGALECDDKTFLPIVDSPDATDEYIAEALGF